VHLFNGLLNHLRKEDVCDWEYLGQHTEGFSAALKTVRESSPSIPSVASACGLDEKDIAEFYQLFSRTEKVVSVFSQGVNQSSSGTDKVNSIINCHLATGRIGKPGMGPFSITGQPNAMGGREVGGLSNQLAAHMELDNPEHRDTVQRFWNSPMIADKAGLKAVDLFRAIEKGDVKAVWIMATNPVVSLPDTNQVRAALEKCELVVVSDCIKNTDTTEFADVLLPAAAWGEKDGTVTNSERRLSRQRAFMDAPGLAKSDWWIICQLAQRLGYQEAFAYQTPADIFREHAALSGFENSGTRDFNIQALQSIDNNEYGQFLPIQWPIQWPTTDKTKPDIPRMFAEGQFYTPSKKAQLIAVTPKDPGQMPDVEFPLILNTGRVRDQWHSMTRTGKSPRLSTHTMEPYLQIHPQDAVRFAVQNNALVRMTSRYGEVVVRATFSIRQQAGSVFMPIHWNHQFASTASVGKVVNPFTDPFSGQPELKHTPVKIELFNAKWQAFLMVRNELALPASSDYWVKAKGLDFWCYELAGLSFKGNREDWARELLQASTEETECIEYTDEASACFRVAHIKNNRLQKCLFVAPGYITLPSRTWLGSLFNREVLNPAERISLLAGKPPAGQIDAGPNVCACFNVGRNNITSCLKNGQASTVEDIGELLQAGINCGSCIPELKELIKDNVTFVPAAESA
jgi:assimilatory nitrate reductase catalytic subunit